MTLNLATIIRQAAGDRPDRVAQVLGDTSTTYAKLYDDVQRLATGLADLGIGKGDNVALMMPNVPQFTLAYYAILHTGATVVPLNVMLTADEIAYHLEDSESKALIAWEAFTPVADGVKQSGGDRTRIVVPEQAGDTDARDGAINLYSLIANNEPMTEPVTTGPEDPAVILYTSGTTGKPKGAQLSHFNMFFNAYYVAKDMLKLGDDTVSMAPLPLFHSFGQTITQNATLVAGGTIVYLPRFDPKSAIDLIEANKVTLFAGVPTMYFALLHYPEADQHDLSSLKYCVSGGAAIPVEVMNSFNEAHNVTILEGYGLSETSPVAAFNQLDHPTKPGSIGLPIPGVELRLTDSEGNVITETDTPGEIEIKGHNVMIGYYRRPEVNAETIVDGWFKTGDVGVRDDDGYYYIVDRKKDMIIRGGYNVYPREIEEVLYTFPGVVEAAVIGVPHESHGEEIKAVLALKEGVTAEPDEVIAFTRQHLAAYKYPRIIEFRDELPKGSTGKILKRELS